VVLHAFVVDSGVGHGKVAEAKVEQTSRARYGAIGELRFPADRTVRRLS
jgi:hypothetical protein